MISFAGQVFLITGAAGGIGHAVALKASAAGAHVALSDLDDAALKNVYSEILDQGGQASIHQTDVSDLSSCERTASAVAAQFGTINHLIHSAGIYPEAMVAGMSQTDWQRVMHVNVDGTFFICQAVIPHLSQNSSIVNLSSVAGHRGSYSHAHYSASKGAVSSFSKSLALELAPRTRVNIVAPGIIETPMTASLLQAKGDTLRENTPLKRFGTAEEVAGAIVFLCSDLAAFVNGETIHVNGGLYIS